MVRSCITAKKQSWEAKEVILFRDRTLRATTAKRRDPERAKSNLLYIDVLPLTDRNVCKPGSLGSFSGSWGSCIALADSHTSAKGSGHSLLRRWSSYGASPPFPATACCEKQERNDLCNPSSSSFKLGCNEFEKLQFKTRPKSRAKPCFQT